MNPEFQRNLWLELPSHRLVAMPAVLVLVFFAAWLAGGSLSFAGAAQLLITLLLIVWGSRLAAEAVLAEVIGHTWDSQRMSALGPWEMTWGKLLGSTAFMWYGCAWCVGAFLFSPHSDFTLLVRLLLAGLEAQALALLLSMVLIRGEPVSLRFQVTIAQTVSVLVIMPFLFFTLFNRPQTVHWYGFIIPFDVFVTVFQIAFVGWTVLGAYQMLRTALQYSSGSLTWLLFVVFGVSFIAGFDQLQPLAGTLGMPTPAVTRLFIGFCAAVGLTYACALVEPKSLVRLRQWLMLLRRGRIRQGEPLSPAWFAALVIAVVLGLLTMVNIVGLKAPTAPLPLGPLALVLAILLFTLRDLALFYYLVLYSRFGGGNLAIAVYLMTAYFLLPVILSSARLDGLMAVLVPSAAGPPELVVLPVLIEALAAIGLVVQRWRAVGIEGLDRGAINGQ
jgi:hypothetical protein